MNQSTIDILRQVQEIQDKPNFFESIPQEAIYLAVSVLIVVFIVAFIIIS